jgi:hypothetical protein
MCILLLPAIPPINLHFFPSETVSPIYPDVTCTLGLNNTKRRVSTQTQCPKQVRHVQDMGTGPQRSYLKLRVTLIAPLTSMFAGIWPLITTRVYSAYGLINSCICGALYSNLPSGSSCVRRRCLGMSTVFRSDSSICARGEIAQS